MPWALRRLATEAARWPERRSLTSAVRQLVLGSLGEFVAVGREEDTVGEGDLDGLQAVGIFDGLDVRIEGGEFFRLLVHLLADDGAGAAADGGADRGADRGALAILADEVADAGTEGGACAGTDQGTGSGVGQAAAADDDRGAKENRSNLFHNTY